MFTRQADISDEGRLMVEVNYFFEIAEKLVRIGAVVVT